MKRIGRYDIVGELGRGAMGVVYKASDPTIGRLVAIKVLSLEASHEEGVPGAREIFMREARAAGRLSHPGIVTIHDALEDPETKKSCIVMEFIPGRTLENVLQSETPLEPARALKIVRDVAEALDYAHRQGIVHRDMKPANILLTEDGGVKITDFGIAKIAAREGTLRTLAIMGTPSYMSPEQVTGGGVDARSDLFSLGVILYLMLVGQKPFAGDTAAVMFKIVYEDPVPPSKVNPRLGPGHDYLVLRCLAKDRSKRYGNAQELLDDLDDVIQGGPPRSQAKVPLDELRAGDRTLVARHPLVSSPGEKARALPMKSALAVAGIAAGVLLVAAAVGLGIWKYQHRELIPAAPTTASSPSAAGPPASSVVPAAVRPAPVATPAGQQVARMKALGGASEEGVQPAPSKPAPARTLQIHCRHEFQEATLTISSGASVLLQSKLKGRKKRGLLGIRGGYAGTFTRTVSLPAGTRELSLHLVSSDGSVDLSKRSLLPSPTGTPVALQVDAHRDRMDLAWKSLPPPASE